MSILSDAWRRARGEEDAVTRALGAPPVHQGSRRGHWLPWLLCGLLLVVVVGMGVYLWRSNLLSRAHPQLTAEAAAGKPAKALAGTVRTQGSASGNAGASHADEGRVNGKAGASTSRAAVSAAGVAHTASIAAVAPRTAPEAVRAQLPPLAVTVHVWNPSPRSRFIIVGGRMYHEGDELSPGLRLVSITQDGEIVNFRGYLITLNGH